MPATGTGPIVSYRPARAYIAKIEGAISGQGGHNVTFRVACALVLGFDLSIDEARPLIEEWNDTCQPPWSDKELEHKLADAEEQSGPRGYLLQADLLPVSRAEGRTEAANAARFVALHSADTRYCDQWGKWLHFDGKRWAIDVERVIDAKAKAVGNIVREQVAAMIRQGSNS